MDTLNTIVDFDDPTYDPFHADEAAYGSIADIYSPFCEALRKSPVHEGDFLTLLGWPQNPNVEGARHFTVLGYNEVAEVSLNADTYSIDINKLGIGLTFGRTLSLLNPPEHTKIRRVFQKAFLPQTVSKWGDSIVGPVVDALVSKFEKVGKADLAAQFALQYPFRIIYQQLALPTRDIVTFHKLAVTMTQTYGDTIRYGIEASRKLGIYFSDMIAQRRKHPGDDLVSVLVQTEVDGERIPDEILISFFRQLINAAGDTTYRGTGALMVALLRNPDQLKQVKADRTLVPLAIEEALRWDGPTPMYYRTVTRDVTLGGVDIPADSIVDVCLGAANHDPTIFPDPMSYNMHRRRDRHFAFGIGPHMCLGQHLARIEMTRALNAILDRLQNLRLDPDMAAPTISGCYLRTPRDINVLFD
jgi:cytochrome P450